MLVDGEAIEGEDARRWKRYKVMTLMHWTLREYQETPATLVDEIYAFALTEHRAYNDAMKEING